MISQYSLPPMTSTRVPSSLRHSSFACILIGNAMKPITVKFEGKKIQHMSASVASLPEDLHGNELICCRTQYDALDNHYLRSEPPLLQLISHPGVGIRVRPEPDTIRCLRYLPTKCAELHILNVDQVFVDPSALSSRFFISRSSMHLRPNGSRKHQHSRCHRVPYQQTRYTHSIFVCVHPFCT